MEFSKTAAVIFDMDGIIFDTERLYIESWKAVAREYDLNNVSDMAYRIIGVNDIMSRKVFTDYYQGTRDYDQCRKRVSEVFHSRYDGKIPVKPGVHEILAFLRERNIPVALASSTRIETVQRELKEAGLYQAFDHIIGGDMIKRTSSLRRQKNSRKRRKTATFSKTLTMESGQPRQQVCTPSWCRISWR